MADIAALQKALDDAKRAEAYQVATFGPAGEPPSENKAPNDTPWYLDKNLYAKLLLPVIILGTSFLNSKLPIPLDPVAIDVMVGGFCAATVAYIVSHSKKTTTLALADKAGAQAVAVAQTKNPADALAAAPDPVKP